MPLVMEFWGSWGLVAGACDFPGAFRDIRDLGKKVLTLT